MKADELRDLTYPDLEERLEEAKADLFNLRFQLAVSQSDNTARTGVLRREIARIKTVMGEWDGEGRPRGYEDGDYEDREDEPYEPAAPAPGIAPVAAAQAPEEELPEAEEPQEEAPAAPEPPEEAPEAEAAPEAPAAEKETPPKRTRLWGKRSRK